MRTLEQRLALKQYQTLEILKTFSPELRQKYQNLPQLVQKAKTIRDANQAIFPMHKDAQVKIGYLWSLAEQYDKMQQNNPNQ